MKIVAKFNIYLPTTHHQATLEADAQRGNERAEGAEKKITDIEEELRVVGANMQQLEIGEEKTIAREEGSQVKFRIMIFFQQQSDNGIFAE